MSISADSLFDFDKQDIKPAGKQSLMEFAAELRNVTYEEITVRGYTDRIGSHAYNMKLSTRRAAAVKAYLVEAGGLPASKVEAGGEEGSAPVTKPGECVGTKRSAALIACLAPDRRVEV